MGLSCAPVTSLPQAMAYNCMPSNLSSHSKLILLAHLYLETRRPHIIPPCPLPFPPFSASLPLSSLPLSLNHEPNRPPPPTAHRVFLENARKCSYIDLPLPTRVLTLEISQATSPSLREILAAFKFSKGQDGDCQLLLAVLNAKSAEDQASYPLPLPSCISTTYRVPCCSEPPRSPICMRACSNPNRIGTLLPLPLLRRIPFPDSTFRHPSHPLDHIRRIPHPPNSATLLTKRQGCTGPR